MLKQFVFIGSLSLTVAAFGAVKNEPISPISLPKISDAKKVELGKKLWFETRLSKSGFLSCNSCHNIMKSGTDNLKSSIGHKWHLGPINSPTVFNAKYNIAQFWDGRAANLKEPAKGPIANPGEMASDHTLAVKVLKSIPEYNKEFMSVYGKSGVNIENIADAIASFEETLVTPNAPFDQWLKGKENAISQLAKKGYNLFKSTGCVSCHNGPAVGGNMYQKFGIVKAYNKNDKNLGRYAVTKKESDKFVYKVPTLRNIEFTYPYFHDGSVWNLGEAVKIMADVQLGKKLKNSEVDAIVAFLKTLSGDRPQITLPLLPPNSAETPNPVVR